jgi:signal transduction histidine kinase/DNA-binding NarL/FixJ family response regulator
LPPESIYDRFLAHQGIALFEFRGSGVFQPLAGLPGWCYSLWRVKRNQSAQLARKSPFLENFLAEAREFWDLKGPGAVNSGNWIERDSAGGQIPLEASAFWLAGKRVLLVRNLSGTFPAQQQLFQTARDSLLTHERLVREIEKKEILLHTIIHDLSQPLTSMRGCFDLLSGKRLAPELAKYVHTGQRESERQERMIRGILEAFSGDLAAESADVSSSDLVSCARRAVEQFAPAFTGRGIQIALAPYQDSQRGWRVAGDAPRVDRIFGNLLENALRYSPNGSTVTVGVEAGDSSLAAFVEDEGPGLPKDVSPDSLFALFSKGGDRPGKVGLGLYFCKMTVERWGGSIGAQARAQRGSRFWFRLPRAEAEESVASSRQMARGDTAPSSNQAARRAPEKELRIIVADDDEAVRELAVDILRTRGHFVTGVADGRAALAAFERVKPDVLLLDQQMPGMDGVTLARAIRRSEDQSGARRRAMLVGLSGSASAEDERRALEAGMDALVGKPLGRDTLFQIIERPGRPISVTESTLVTEPQMIDLRAHLTRITRGDNRLARKLATGFLRDFPRKLSAIARALSRKNAAELASAAHALRGSFAIFNAHKSVAAARKLEAMGREGQLGSAADEFRTLSTDLGRLESELRALFPSSPAPRRRARPTGRVRSKR